MTDDAQRQVTAPFNAQWLLRQIRLDYLVGQVAIVNHFRDNFVKTARLFGALQQFRPDKSPYNDDIILMQQTISHFSRLVTTVRRLRDENGCPWDRKQTTASLVKYLDEEFQEILAAIAADDRTNLCEELGDFLYLIIMLSEINAAESAFDLDDVLLGVSNKLIRRHPHVFAGTPVMDEAALTRQWQAIKEQEKRAKK